MTMVAVIGVLIWAGVRNLHARRLAMQKVQESHLMMMAPSEDGSDLQAPALKLVGKPAPAFALVDLTGKKVALIDYKGRPVLVNFWATWCGPCKEEMPWLEEFEKQYSAQGFEVLGITTDALDVKKKKVAQTAQAVGATYPILLTDGKVDDLYDQAGDIPVSFYVDRKGNVADADGGRFSSGWQKLPRRAHQEAGGGRVRCGAFAVQCCSALRWARGRRRYPWELRCRCSMWWE